MEGNREEGNWEEGNQQKTGDGEGERRPEREREEHTVAQISVQDGVVVRV